MLDKILEQIHKLLACFKRMNQIILSFPIWIIIGFTGLMREENGKNGWIKSEKNENYEEMY